MGEDGPQSIGAEEMSKSVNVGSFDRAIRFVIGVALIPLPHLAKNEMFTNAYALYGLSAIGGVLILTAMFSFCPLYRLIGVNTSRRAI